MGAGGGGLLCWDETMSTEMDEVFLEMTKLHHQALKAVGGKYIPQDHEPECADTLGHKGYPRDHKRPCAIRLARAAFFNGTPPQHHRFDDPRIPAHITYAYQEGATIVENEAFYTLPKGRPKTIDLLFLNANAPLKTASM